MTLEFQITQLDREDGRWHSFSSILEQGNPIWLDPPPAIQRPFPATKWSQERENGTLAPPGLLSPQKEDPHELCSMFQKC